MPGIENLAPERTDTSSGFCGVAEALAGASLHLAHRVQHVVPEAGRQRLAVGEVVVAGFRGDGESGRRRQTREGHLGEAGALAAEQVLHGAVAFGGAVPQA